LISIYFERKQVVSFVDLCKLKNSREAIAFLQEKDGRLKALEEQVRSTVFRAIAAG